MSSNRKPNEYLIRLYSSPAELREALRKHASDYMKYKEFGYLQTAKEHQRPHQAAKTTGPSVVEGDGFIMSDSRQPSNPTQKMKDSPVKKEGNELKTAFAFVSFIRDWFFPNSESSEQTASPRSRGSHQYEPRGVSKESRELLLTIAARHFHDAVSCLAAHKQDGWSDAIGNDVVKAIDQAYATHDHDPQKALDAVAALLAKLE